MKRILCRIKSSFDDGIVYIFGSSVVAQFCALISSMFVIRFLAKDDYGEYVKASNVYDYIAIFVGMGLTTSILQFCSENIEEYERNAIYLYSLKKGSSFNFILVFITIVLSAFENLNGNMQISLYILSMCLLPVTQYFLNYAQTVFRVKRNNKEYAISNILYSIILCVGNYCFSQLLGVYGLIISLYFSCLTATAYCAYEGSIKGFFLSCKSATYQLGTKAKNINYYAITCVITNFSYNILLLLDITLLDFFVSKNEILADYKVASKTPSALLFVSSSLITFFYPQMVEKISLDPTNIKRYLTELGIIFFCVNGMIFVFIEFFAPTFISLIYGSKYLSCIPIFRVLGINFLFASTIRKLLGNMIAVTKNVKINFIHNLIAGGVNVILDITLIPSMGSMGAAIATTICTLLMSVMEIIFIARYIHKVETKK